MWRRARSICRVLTRRSGFERGMNEELQFHLDARIEDLVRGGLAEEEAARQARIDLGSVHAVKDDCREARGLRVLDQLHQDVRYATRLMRKTPGFTLAVLGTLAVCLGANLTIFAAVDAILLRSLPFPGADRLVTVFNTYPKAGVDRDGASLTNYYERRGRLAAFTSLAIFRHDTAIVGEAGAAQSTAITEVSPDFFATLGVGPVIGRAFTDEEMTYATHGVVILTDASWRRLSNADPGVLGRRLRIDGAARQVVGVLPAGFRFLSSDAALYVPLSSDAASRGPGRRHSGNSISMIGRLAPGITLGQAQAQIDAHNAAVEADNPHARLMADAGFRSVVGSLHADHVASIRPTLLLVQAGVLFLLIIGCVNVANLLLIRAGGRVNELAIRQAIGARRYHVVAEVMTETVLLTLLGGLLGLLVGAAGTRLLAALGAAHLPLGAQIAFDARLSLVALAGTLVLGGLIGVPIAWYHLRTASGLGLVCEPRSTPGRAAQRLRHVFLVAQIALAFTLLAGASLLGLSLKKAMAVAPGFRPDQVVSGQVSLPWQRYRDGRARFAFADRVLERISQQPGVAAAGAASAIPLGGSVGQSAITPKGHAAQPGTSPRGHYFYGVAGAYFTALGIPLEEGRLIDSTDSRRPERVAVVDHDFARRYWPNGGALGQRLFLGTREGPDAEAYTIVGVVGAVKQATLTDRDALGAVYVPHAYMTHDAAFIVVRTAAGPASMATALQQIVRELDSEVIVHDVKPMAARVEDSLLTRRSPAILAGIFAAVALLLTAIGTYGVLSYAVAQRRREIGLRMALGAQPAQVRRQFLTLALQLLTAGTIVGVGGAWLAGWAMQAVLFDVPALHFPTLIGTAAVLIAVSVAACLLPSQRAARISPIEALLDR